MRRPKIGLNATCFDDRPSGAKQRFLGIYAEVIRQSPDVDFVIYEPADCRVADWFGWADNVSARRTPIPSRGRLERQVRGLGYWAQAFRTDHFDLFEGFHLPFTSNPRCPNLLTIHDLRPLLGARWTLEKLAYRRVLASALGRAALVIAVSDTVRGEILDFSARAKVSTLYNGIDVDLFRRPDPSELADVSKRLELPRPFILSVGHLEPRKNYDNLILAFSTIATNDPEISLVIVGNDSGQKQRLTALAEAHQLTGRLRILSSLSDADVRGLYHLAELVAFPSLYEGFGIPILEAMAANKAIVTSDLAVFRELTEDQGSYFDPADVKAIANTLQTVLHTPDERDRLVRYGQRRVQDFAFSALGTLLRGLYDRVMLTAGAAMAGN